MLPTSFRRTSLTSSFALWTILVTILSSITVCKSNFCFECSTLDDTYCPEIMSDGDDGIVAYKDCSYIHESYYCVKTTGVTGGTLGIHCFRCSENTDEDFGCTDLLFSAKLTDCSDVFDAYYCIKTTGSYGGSLGTKRFCSSKDMGNYCQYINRPGDKLQYRSCVFTCTGDGCNPGVSTNLINSSSQSIFILAASVLPLLLYFYQQNPFPIQYN